MDKLLDDKEIQGAELKVDYVSIMKEANKLHSSLSKSPSRNKKLSRLSKAFKTMLTSAMPPLSLSKKKK